MTQAVQALAWTLIHFCWQAAAIAILYRGVSALVAGRSSNTRYLTALGALLLTLGGAVGTFTYELNAGTPSSAVAEFVTPYRISPATTSAPAATQVSDFRAAASAAPARPSYFALPAFPLPALRALVALWLFGVFALSLRSLGGWWLIQRLRSTAQIEAPPAVRASFYRIKAAFGIHKPVLLRISSALSGPVTVGTLKALVVLPISAATSLGPDELEVVLAHELAHVRRADFFWNLIQTLAETLFFFHPAVWWMSSRIRELRELCCDDLALSVCPDPVTYAGTLFRLEELRSQYGQLTMALDGNQPKSALRMRIARILGEPATDVANRGQFTVAAAASILLLLVLGVPQLVSGLNPTSPTTRNAAKIVTSTTSTIARSQATEVRSDSRAAAQKPSPSLLSAKTNRDSDATELVAQASAPEPPQSTPAPSGKGDYIDRMKAAGYDVDLDKYIAMKVQDITPEYAAAMSQAGFGKLSADDLIACKVQGVTPEFIAGVKQNGLEAKTVQDVISYKIFDVSPEFIAKMKDAGFSNLSSHQLLEMRVQGVTPEYAQSIVKQYPGATTEDIVKTKIFNIDAAFIEQAKKHGFTDLTLEKLVKLRISGVMDDESAK